MQAAVVLELGVDLELGDPLAQLGQQVRVAAVGDLGGPPADLDLLDALDPPQLRELEDSTSTSRSSGRRPVQAEVPGGRHERELLDRDEAPPSPRSVSSSAAASPQLEREAGVGDKGVLLGGLLVHAVLDPEHGLALQREQQQRAALDRTEVGEVAEVAAAEAVLAR